MDTRASLVTCPENKATHAHPPTHTYAHRQKTKLTIKWDCVHAPKPSQHARLVRQGGFGAVHVRMGGSVACTQTGLLLQIIAPS